MLEPASVDLAAANTNEAQYKREQGHGKIAKAPSNFRMMGTKRIVYLEYHTKRADDQSRMPKDVTVGCVHHCKPIFVTSPSCSSDYHLVNWALVEISSLAFGSAMGLPAPSAPHMAKWVFIEVDAYEAVLRRANATLPLGNALHPPRPRVVGARWVGVRIGVGVRVSEKKCIR